MQMIIYFKNYLFTFLVDSCLRVASKNITSFFKSAIGSDVTVLVEDTFVLFLAIQLFNGTEITALWKNALKECNSNENPS